MIESSELSKGSLINSSVTTSNISSNSGMSGAGEESAFAAAAEFLRFLMRAKNFMSSALQ